jgi:hypothetical protein
MQRILTALSAQVDHLRYQQSHDDDNGIDLLSMEAIAPDAEFDPYTQHPLLAMAASNDPDTLHYHEAMKASDRKEFIKAMYDKVRKSSTGEVYKHKSRLNIGGHKQTEGIDYDQTYSTVVTWPSI